MLLTKSKVIKVFLQFLKLDHPPCFIILVIIYFLTDSFQLFLFSFLVLIQKFDKVVHFPTLIHNILNLLLSDQQVRALWVVPSNSILLFHDLVTVIHRLKFTGLWVVFTDPFHQFLKIQTPVQPVKFLICLSTCLSLPFNLLLKHMNLTWYFAKIVSSDSLWRKHFRLVKYWGRHIVLPSISQPVNPTFIRLFPLCLKTNPIHLTAFF
jgi:hypothetical protein